MADTTPQQLYVLDGTLVSKTGRTATRESQKTTLRKTVKFVETIVEVLPVDTEDGTWKRWVSEDELFVVN